MRLDMFTFLLITIVNCSQHLRIRSYSCLSV